MKSDVSNNNQIDYRNIAALFSKALTMNMLQPPKLQAAAEPRRGCWTVLGYFDFLQIYPLPQEKRFWLSDILKHNQDLSAKLDGDYYFHPFHLTAGMSGEESEDEYRLFWTENDDMPFLFLTLVQESRLGSIQAVRKALMSQGNKGTVKRVCYRTMDLSDLVVVWRSGSMFDIFQAIHELYQMEEVGDLSSFSSISQDFINDPDISKGAKIDPGKEFFVSARYVVRSSAESRNYIRQLRDAGIDVSHIYFSTGMEDLHMLQEHMSMADFLKLLRAHLGDAHSRAFFECSTRLGIQETAPAPPPPPMPPQDETPEARENSRDGAGKVDCVFSENCRSLLTRFQDVRKRTASVSGHNEMSWMKPASNLLNALADMSKNCVMDGFCYLTYDAARLFCKKIESWSKLQRNMKTKRETDSVQRFIRGWGGLMEQATRTDGRFIQMPGFSPALCDIPAYLLEFYLSVMMCCADLMSGQPERHDVALLLVPKICRRMKVLAILEEPRGQDHLLYVDIPMEMLYEPVSVLCCLCHELAHYVGETWRKRQLRGKQIIYCAAYELAGHLNIRSDSVIREIHFRLKELCELKDKSDINYAASLSVLLQMGIKSLISDDKMFSKWHEIYRDSQNMSAAETRLTQFESDVCRGRILADSTRLFDDLENLIHLFRECYADMVMLYLLNPSQEMYMSFAEQELDSLAENRKDFRYDNQYYVFVERWGLVIRVAYQKGLWKRNNFEPAPVNTSLGSFYRDVDKFIDWFDSGCDRKIEAHRSKETLQQVFDYLANCYDTIEELLTTGSNQDAAHLSQLHKLFEGLSKHYEIDYQACEQFTRLYRETILKKQS